MGGCASKPKDLDTQAAPAPVEKPIDTTEKAEETTETKTQEPLVDLSEAPKVEEAAAESTKPEEAAEKEEKEKEKEAEAAESSEATSSAQEINKAEEPQEKEDKKDEAAAKPQDN